MSACPRLFPCLVSLSPPVLFSVFPQVTGTLGHQDTWTLGQQDNGAIGLQDNGWEVKVRVPTYRKRVVIFIMMIILAVTVMRFPDKIKILMLKESLQLIPLLVLNFLCL